jgi:hypothetical protein
MKLIKSENKLVTILFIVCMVLPIYFIVSDRVNQKTINLSIILLISFLCGAASIKLRSIINNLKK